MAPHPWIGRARFLFIPLIVEGVPGWDEPPDDYEEFVRRRVYFDPDPQTREDRSLMSYIEAISYGRATMDATVSAPVTLKKLGTKDNPTLLAIYAQPDAHRYEYLAVVYPPNRVGAGGGMAQDGQVDFTPPRSPNVTKGRSRFLFDASIGTWAMEILHIATGIGDYYNGVKHPGRFDEMADSAATHPSSYTKLLAGWLDSAVVPMHADGTRKSYTLHAVGLPQPSPGGRVAGVRVQTPGSQRYLIVEARLRSDRWERGFASLPGIPSEGVVIYEFSPESMSWQKKNPTGPWPPLELRTPTALTVGQSYLHPATGTRVRVSSATAGGFRVEIASKEVAVPSVEGLPRAAAEERIRAVGLRPLATGDTGSRAVVWRQFPSAGTRVAYGSVVRLQLRVGLPPDDRDDRDDRGDRRPPRTDL
jgi:PASTA domain